MELVESVAGYGLIIFGSNTLNSKHSIDSPYTHEPFLSTSSLVPVPLFHFLTFVLAHFFTIFFMLEWMIFESFFRILPFIEHMCNKLTFLQ